MSGSRSSSRSNKGSESNRRSDRSPRDGDHLEFINMTTSDRTLGPSQRRSIRSHAMHEYLKEKRGSGRSEDGSSEAGPSVQFEQIQPKAQDFYYLMFSDPSTHLSPDRADPFEAAALPLRLHMRNAIQYAIKYQDSAMLPTGLTNLVIFSPSSAILEVALRHESTLHAFVSVWSYVMDPTRPNPLKESLYHRGEALTLIRETIGSGLSCAFPNQVQLMIFAITLLCPIEGILGNREAHKQHMIAIKALAGQLGGLEKLGYLKHVILEVESGVCMVLHCEHSFEPNELGISLDITRHIQFDRLSPGTLMNIVAEIRLLQEFLEGLEDLDMNRKEALPNIKLVLEIRALIEYCLVRIKDYCEDVYAAFRLAILCYMHIEFRSVRLTDHALLSLCGGVRWILPALDGDAFRERQSLLLWILFTCGHQLQEAELRTWYLGAAQVTCHNLAIFDFHGVRITMSKTLWSKQSEQSLLNFWTECQPAIGGSRA